MVPSSDLSLPMCSHRLLRALRVQTGGRLVEEDQRRLVHQPSAISSRRRCPPDSVLTQPLLEPARGRAGRSAASARCPASAGPRRYSAAWSSSSSITRHDGRCRPSSRRWPAARSRSSCAPPAGPAAGRHPPPSRSPRSAEQRGQHAQRGGLARAVRPEEADDLPVADGQVHAPDRLDRAFAALEGPREPPRLDDPHFLSLSLVPSARTGPHPGPVSMPGPFHVK